LIVGTCRVWLRLPENHSLKGKRQVIKSLVARIHNRFNVAAAEIDDQDSWQMISLGVSCVSNDDAHAHEVLEKVVTFIQSERPDLEFLEYRTEIVSALNGARF